MTLKDLHPQIAHSLKGFLKELQHGEIQIPQTFSSKRLNKEVPMPKKFKWTAKWNVMYEKRKGRHFLGLD